jgi:hypothetical protein
MTLATIHVSAFNNPGDAEAPPPTRDRIRFHVLAEVTYSYERATHVSPAEEMLIVHRIKSMDVAFDVASTDFSCEDGESWQGDRAGDTYEWEFTDHASAEQFLEAWGIDLEMESDWEFDHAGPDGPDPDDQRDQLLDRNEMDRSQWAEEQRIDEAHEAFQQEGL